MAVIEQYVVSQMVETKFPSVVLACLLGFAQEKLSSETLPNAVLEW